MTGDSKPIQLPRVTLPRVTMYTDGASLGNPGPGGYGVILESDGHQRELSAGYHLTTNNRMEIMAVIAGLEALRRAPSAVTVYSDSQYLVNSMSKGWVESWHKKGWKRADGQPALNADLWARLLDLCERHVVTFKWVHGHAGHPENERADRLAVRAAKGANPLEDRGYTSPQTIQPEIAQAELLAAEEAPAMPANAPDNRAVSVGCKWPHLWIELRDGRALRVPLEWFPPLVQASPGQRHDYQLADDGRTIHFPALDLRIRLDETLGLSAAAASPHQEQCRTR